MNFKKTKKAWGHTLLCLSLSGVVYTAAPITGVYAQSNDVLNRLNRLENELDTLNRAVYRGEKPVLTQMPDEAAAQEAARNIANGEIRLQQLETQIRELTGRIEEQQYQINQIQNQMNAVQAAQNSASAAPVQNERTRVFSSTQGAIQNDAGLPQPVASNTPSQIGTSVLGGQIPARMQTLSTGNSGEGDPTLQYEQAFADLKNESYAQAQKGFEDFLAVHKDHVLASNAKYWLGETFYVQGNFDKAARTFAEGYRSYPDSPKSPDNLLKLGVSLAALGKTEDACVALGQLPKKHADGPGPVLSRGVQEMERLGCGS